VVPAKDSTSGRQSLLVYTVVGKLMTHLKEASGLARPFISDAVITDGNWYRVELTWDDSIRTLYVDDIEVAADTQSRPQSCSGGLYLGAGQDPTAGTLFSGLIDDVKIYSRAILP